ncbi:hypothetical protein D5R81_01485 [Parashewanella spongiae]|uniref:Uncharacterized protein n=1 Tax=Parashewanella spongiae TaxID=342950 RepID=A0A3A6UBC4_9GAMM|nr:hypothetical protein [Parashewanella spongiae]MCL1076781.1 hypothetical protein [Parashewanella spongiae]RJY19294.1 hypothetical protein D5R81_01485 [Parashewanella spongiae]
MHIALKAGLYSAFVLPGSGHLLLKKRYRGYAFIAVTLISLIMLLQSIMAISQQVADKIVSGELPIELGQIMAEIHQGIYGELLVSAGFEFKLLVACWLLSTIDSIREGLKAYQQGLK